MQTIHHNDPWESPRSSQGLGTDDAIVIGSGPNGLVAANRLADAGWSVDVLEGAATPGGAVRTEELTEPGFRHDVFSAFYPLAAASPAIRSLELERHGLEWCHGPLVLANPTPDGGCVVLSRDLDETAASLDAFAAGDGDAWRELYGLWRRIEPHLLRSMVTPTPPLRGPLGLLRELGGPKALLRLARLGVLPVRHFAAEHFDGEGAALLLAGNIPACQLVFTCQCVFEVDRPAVHNDVGIDLKQACESGGGVAKRIRPSKNSEVFDRGRHLHFRDRIDVMWNTQLALS